MPIYFANLLINLKNSVFWKLLKLCFKRAKKQQFEPEIAHLDQPCTYFKNKAKYTKIGMKGGLMKKNIDNIQTEAIP